jgi:cytoskeletal protein RodZ
METEHFGTCLRRARENRDLVLGDVALKIKVARTTLEHIEHGQLAELPAGVYVRGFIRSFARAVGADETEPLLLFERALEAKSRAERTREVTPVMELPVTPPGANVEEEALTPRRGLGLAVFVIILLLIATITLSLLLRRPPPTGEGLSLAPPSSVASGSTRSS